MSSSPNYNLDYFLLTYYTSKTIEKEKEILNYSLTKITRSVLLLFRFLNGLAYGVVLSAVSVYIVEIATTDMRGFLGCFVQFQVNFIYSGYNNHRYERIPRLLCTVPGKLYI